MAVPIPETVRVLLPTNTIKRMPLEEYVQGVVSAALPADTPLEALKAQAVAARTFGSNTHRHLERGADVCVHRHCQVWTEKTFAAATRAVLETTGEVALYEGELIEAFYFLHCDGRTRDPSGLLPKAPGYLRPVSCSCGFATLKGHGIGLCQRGAVVMARFGESYESILKHYYSGIALERGLPKPEEPEQPSRPPAELRRAVREPRTEPAVEKAKIPEQPLPRADAEKKQAAASVEPVSPSPQDVQEAPSVAPPAPIAVEPVAALHASPAPSTQDEASSPPQVTETKELPTVQPKDIPVETFFAAHPMPESTPEPMRHAAVSPATDTRDEQSRPLQEREAVTSAPQPSTVLVDTLPGPRVIAGNLARPGIIVAIRDREGHAVVTVSGTVSHHGPGGFEAPLDHDGTFTVTFDNRELEVVLEDETVFIGYAE